MCKSYGLSFRKPGSALLSPCIEVNTSKICVLTKLDKDSVVGALKSIVSKLGEFMGSGDHVQVPFGDLGTLISQKRVVSFKFNTGGISAPGNSEKRSGQQTTEMDQWLEQFMTRKASEVSAANAAIAAAEEQQRQASEMDSSAQHNQAPESAASSQAIARSTSRSRRSSKALSKPGTAQPAVSPSASHRDGDSGRRQLGNIPSEILGQQERESTPSWIKDSYSVKKNRLEQIMANHVFPKFLIPEKPRSFATTNPAVIRNMEIAYDRLERTIGDLSAAKQKQQVELNLAQEKAYEDYMSRRRKERDLRIEIKESLDRQSTDDRHRKREEAEKDKEECQQVVKVGHKAYPMAKFTDLQQEYDMKKNLRDSLLAQVTTKTESENLKRKADIAREQKILSTLTRDLRRERKENWEGKMGGNRSMMNQWEKQIAVTKRLRDIDF